MHTLGPFASVLADFCLSTEYLLLARSTTKVALCLGHVAQLGVGQQAALVVLHAVADPFGEALQVAAKNS